MPKLKTTPEAILRSAWAVFHRHGYHHASLQQLADAAGLGKAGILHHFGSKAGVMRAVIAFAIDWYERKVLSIVDGEGDLETRFEAFERKHFELCLLNEGSGCFFANSILETGVDGEFAPELRQFHEKWLAAMQRLLMERFSEEEATERAYRLFADYQGSVLLFKLYRDPIHLERLIDRSLENLHLPITTSSQ